jgi:hypothetical protein
MTVKKHTNGGFEPIKTGILNWSKSNAKQQQQQSPNVNQINDCQPCVNEYLIWLFDSINSKEKQVGRVVDMDGRAHSSQEMSDNTLFERPMESKYTKLVCWYTNPTSLNNKIDEARALLSTHKPDIFCVAETWFNETSDTKISGYSL